MIPLESDINLLLRMRFPGSNAPPPLDSLSTEQAGWQERQRQQEAYRAELLALEATQVREMANRERQRIKQEDADRRELICPAAHEIDGAYWKRQERWALGLASILLCDVEPNRGLGAHLCNGIGARPSVHRPAEVVPLRMKGELTAGLSDHARELLVLAEEIMDNAMEAAKLNKLNIQEGSVVPRDFLVWARDRHYKLPPALKSIVQDVPSREELEETIRQLKEELTHSLDQFDPDDKHYPPELDIAYQAWTAMRNEHLSPEESVKSRMMAWIGEHYAYLTPQAIERIAIVANWGKQPGRKRKSKK